MQQPPNPCKTDLEIGNTVEGERYEVGCIEEVSSPGWTRGL